MCRTGIRYAFTAGLTLCLCVAASAQQSTVYAVVVSTRLFVVGAANPRTGLFFQKTGDDTLWGHTGPTNIRAFGVAIGPGSGGRVFYIAAGNGLHKSTDRGTHWRITTGWNITEVLGVSPDPVDTNVVYIATPYGIYKSVDGCATWREMNIGLSSRFCTCVVVDRSQPAKVYCATEGGAYVSTNCGASWGKMGLSVSGVRTIAQHPRNPEVLAVGTEEHGIYLSTNGGRWWTKSESGLDHSTFYTITFDPSKPDVMYAGGYVTGVYKSLDGGKSWKRVNEGLTQLTIHTIAVDPLNSGTVYAGAYWGGVFRTDDGGGRWKNIGPADSQVWTLVIDPH